MGSPGRNGNHCGGCLVRHGTWRECCLVEASAMEITWLLLERGRDRGERRREGESTSMCSCSKDMEIPWLLSSPAVVSHRAAHWTNLTGSHLEGGLEMKFTGVTPSPSRPVPCKCSRARKGRKCIWGHRSPGLAWWPWIKLKAYSGVYI